MNKKLTPRLKLATRLYATGAVRTKEEAAEAAGLSPSYFYVRSAPGHEDQKVNEYLDDIDQAIHEKTVDTATILEALGREALARMRQLALLSQNEAIVFKASQDLLDRSPETSKIQKHAVAGFSLDGQDAKELAKAMVEAARIKQAYAAEISQDFVRVPIAGMEEDAIIIEDGPSAQDSHHAKELRGTVREVRQGDEGDDEAGGRTVSSFGTNSGTPRPVIGGSGPGSRRTASEDSEAA